MTGILWLISIYNNKISNINDNDVKKLIVLKIIQLIKQLKKKIK